ncbi:hypothetical protein E0H80_02200 [Acinetobacter sp. ANC 4779]|uniref:hypothetical protein n=1 Tax=Acinetobacter sp. ANC 4779 TaxID=2529848 RepID=UPI00103C6789|nr:hypothetical protein [Acinetobacter sp. ANC 4779]TCB52668.1 hypothetical protein E0H80_02200 [Acinetobacter sp. ANC 4779]
MSWVAAAAVAAAASAAITGYSSYQNNKGMQEQAEADAKATAAQGRVEAARIRKEKEKAQSTARASLAENGLDVNEGTSIVINDEIERAGNYDANMTEITGYNSSQRLKAEASQYKSNASTALAAGAANTIAAGAKGWK